jgi:hypothetical protein
MVLARCSPLETAEMYVGTDVVGRAEEGYIGELG